ncbi:hypothetical protein A33Q_3366 [Indibacter alkaliphilus LW1]|uniref:Fibrobacter succinogenes major paralogous domain-containing protein n=2 Tax=Indibacter TaxID=647744 RepID=S2DSX5_INDAL|nr:hypothetical protein A33Q_3366 [Indibacter alkaliphilus LW1]
MAENLRVSKFLNGVSVDNVSDADRWSRLEEPAFSWLENDSNNEQIYGKLYNGIAVACCPICPEGWRLPNSKEVENLSLERFRSQSSFVYHELGWANENTFSGGYRNANGVFIKENTFDGTMSYFWELDEGGVPNIYKADYIIDFVNSFFLINHEVWPLLKSHTGAYIRCVKEK